jgi:hypothetical protein
MAIHSAEIRGRSPAAGNPATHPHTKYYPARTDSNLHGFIHHPPGFPIEWRTLRQKQLIANDGKARRGNIGLCFETNQYIKPDTMLEVTIQVRSEIQKFTGRVILVRNKGELFEIGIWFTSKTDASRIRMVEQICHIEAYLTHKRHHEGPFVSPERVAQEWISRFASRFPSFG